MLSTGAIIGIDASSPSDGPPDTLVGSSSLDAIGAVACCVGSSSTGGSTTTEDGSMVSPSVVVTDGTAGVGSVVVVAPSFDPSPTVLLEYIRGNGNAEYIMLKAGESKGIGGETTGTDVGVGRLRVSDEMASSKSAWSTCLSI